mmetsp:Transcript_41499/g.163322  ORF Transcript_41499/g.163322 Transcript_41499/m.163322 type:complete len:202 (+) Transcript_41499:1914-2519(+)
MGDERRRIFFRTAASQAARCRAIRYRRRRSLRSTSATIAGVSNLRPNTRSSSGTPGLAAFPLLWFSLIPRISSIIATLTIVLFANARRGIVSVDILWQHWLVKLHGSICTVWFPSGAVHFLRVFHKPSAGVVYSQWFIPGWQRSFSRFRLLRTSCLRCKRRPQKVQVMLRDVIEMMNERVPRPKLRGGPRPTGLKKSAMLC